ncbi:hypothetical protein A3K79_06200 [Candidatus Bathyarchaeota archaeon RBG_13_46_16b]|nr:MAG: hypothetical protein A3K79_06200 [Candidatus Bathyarchaeota archaeon RBG_13_46_16b]
MYIGSILSLARAEEEAPQPPQNKHAIGTSANSHIPKFLHQLEHIKEFRKNGTFEMRKESIKKRGELRETSPSSAQLG